MQRPLTGHLHCGTHCIFKIAGVISRGLVSTWQVHAIVTRAYLAQSEPEMACDRFGFLERHGASMLYQHPLIGGCDLVALPHAPDLLLCAKYLFVAAMRRRPVARS